MTKAKLGKMLWNQVDGRLFLETSKRNLIGVNIDLREILQTGSF